MDGTAFVELQQRNSSGMLQNKIQCWMYWRKAERYGLTLPTSLLPQVQEEFCAKQELLGL